MPRNQPNKDMYTAAKAQDALCTCDGVFCPSLKDPKVTAVGEISRS